MAGATVAGDDTGGFVGGGEGPFVGGGEGGFVGAFVGAFVGSFVDGGGLGDFSAAVCGGFRRIVEHT